MRLVFEIFAAILRLNLVAALALVFFVGFIIAAVVTFPLNMFGAGIQSRILNKSLGLYINTLGNVWNGHDPVK